MNLMMNSQPQGFGLQVRSWNNTPISRRTTDGYVDATAMAKANGKEWAHYFRTDRATTYLKALSRNCEIAVTDLYIAKQGEGTWIHPRLAVDFARWISAEFAVWMDGWFLEELEQRRQPEKQAPAAPVALAPAEALDIIERSIGLLERLGVMDERDCLQMGDMVRNVNARAAGGMLLAPASADDEEITLSDAWLEVTGTPLPRGKAPSIGRLIAEQYREEFQQEPPTRTQFVDGAPRKVKSYRRNFLIQAVQETWAKFVA
jgi:hypothetical protein